MDNTVTESFVNLYYNCYRGESRSPYSWKYAQSKQPYAIISASQPEMTSGKKYMKQCELFFEPRARHNCNTVYLHGGFVEFDYMNRIGSRDELSIFIHNISLTDAINLGIQNQQDFILYSDGISAPALYLTSEKHGIIGDVWIEFEGVELVDIQNAVKHYFDRLIRSVNPLDFSVSKPLECQFRLYENNVKSEDNMPETWEFYSNRIL